MIHEDDPFAPTGDNRTRRVRGRLASSVTIITSGDESSRTGLTVSSLFVVDGAPAMVYAVITPNSDLYDVAGSTGAFVVHICNDDHAGLADVFAGIRPSPGGMFAGADVAHTRWGPVLSAIENRIYCSTKSIGAVGWSGVLMGDIDDSDISDLTHPLLYFRGAYRKLQ